MQPTPGAEGIDARTEHRLETGDADLALGVLPDIAPGLYQQSLFTQDWACLANARHPRIAEDLPLAAIGGLQVFPCPFPIPSFTVRQHWHARFHHDAGNRWLRGVCAGLFLRSGQAVA